MLARYGQGEYVYDANEYRYGGGAFGRSTTGRHRTTSTPTAARMHRLGLRLGAEDRDVEPFWPFGAGRAPR